MTNSKMMGARVPQSWAEQIEAIATEEGCTSSEVCRRAFGQFLGKRSKGQASLQQRVRKLEKQFAAMAAQLMAGED